MMGWVKANLFLLAVVLLGAGLMWLLAFSMWSLGLEPDQYPVVTGVGAVACLFLTYLICKWIYKRLQ